MKRNRQPDCLLSMPVFWLSDRSIPDGTAVPSLKERHDQNRDASENLTRERSPVVSQVVEKQLFSVFPETGRFVFRTTCHCSGVATAASRRSGKAGFRGGRTPAQSSRNRFFQAVAYRRDKKIVLFNRGRPRVGQAAVPSVGYDEEGLGNTCADRQGTRCRRLHTGRKGKTVAIVRRVCLEEKDSGKPSGLPGFFQEKYRHGLCACRNKHPFFWPDRKRTGRERP